jgi:decaprenylphospho-beta-D-ribofuranose 2-oxidase
MGDLRPGYSTNLFQNMVQSAWEKRRRALPERPAPIPQELRQMALPAMQVELGNWSKSARSPCFVYPVHDVTEIGQALSTARAQRLSVLPHGAGHSYTDAALNTGGLVIDITPMRRILAWDAAQGIMRVEPGVMLRDVVQVASQDGWWPFVLPSTPDVTVGGCAAMNINGKNAWKCGPFGAHILSLDVLFPTGEARTLSPGRDQRLFHAVVGSMGLLGIITSITLQVERIAADYVSVKKRRAASLGEIFAAFTEEARYGDFIEAWLDGFATGPQLGRGIVTCAAMSRGGSVTGAPLPTPDRPEMTLVPLLARLARTALLPSVRTANRAYYGWGRWRRAEADERLRLAAYTFWPNAAFAGYHALLPRGVETLQAFVPGPQAQAIFERLLRFSQQQGCLPIWCVIKQHRADPFLLSYQVDGFSLECNYPRTQPAGQLQQVLEHMIAMVIEAGGKFYLAKDHFMTAAQYRRSVGEASVDAFLQLKERYDPDMRLQSDLFRRLFRPASA